MTVTGCYSKHIMRFNKSSVPSLRRPSSSLSPSPPPLTSLRGTVQSHTAFILLHTSQPPPTFPARGLVSQVSKRLQLGTVKWGGVVNWVWSKSNESDHHHRATVFSKNGQLEIPRVGLDNVDEVAELARGFAVGSAANSNLEEGVVVVDDDEIHLLVCTHMARDCRCGEQGGAFVQRLREEIEYSARLKGVARIKIGEVGHVGGHQYVPFLSGFT